MTDVENIPAEPKPQKVNVPHDVLKDFKKCVDGFLTKKECLKHFGFRSYAILKNILRDGTCAPETLDKINDGLERQKNAA